MIENQIEEEGFMDFATVEERLVEGMTVLLRSSDRERAWLRTATMSLWRQVQSEVNEDDEPLVTCSSTRAQVERADQAMSWIAHIVPSGETRRIVGLALLQLARDQPRVSWKRVLRQMGGLDSGWTIDGLRKRYSRAVTDICMQLNARNS